jgi:hypothetical protein
MRHYDTKIILKMFTKMFDLRIHVVNRRQLCFEDTFRFHIRLGIMQDTITKFSAEWTTDTEHICLRNISFK